MYATNGSARGRDRSDDVLARCRSAHRSQPIVASVTAADVAVEVDPGAAIVKHPMESPCALDALCPQVGRRVTDPSVSDPCSTAGQWGGGGWWCVDLGFVRFCVSPSWVERETDKAR